MAQFIHLSLLLATIQLPLVFSATQIWLREGITFKFTGGGNVKRCCKSVLGIPVIHTTLCDSFNFLNHKTLTIDNPNLNDTFVCYDDNNVPVLYLNVTRGCIQTYLDKAEFSNGQKEKIKSTNKTDCRRRCTEDQTCKYFTFQRNVNLFLQGGDEGLRFYQEAKSWIDALEYCQDEGENSSLVHITNQTVQNAVKSLLIDKTDSMQNGAWIGLERSIFGKDVPWRWTSGPQVQKPEQWSSNFPHDRLNNHCGKIIWVKGSQEFKWLDACCHEKLPFICQAMNERSGSDDDHSGDLT
ncbi:uncharacterized protein LOC118342019 [Morone saxatilis]|uniref:uncharacterized protein LOC118342019 n=1 Tax=Morone saxatilis TaxID=34816 RepID=UPI0015E22776|nr:uncharacterized protein LOC118342019 [Morone saxatilis]